MVPLLREDLRRHRVFAVVHVRRLVLIVYTRPAPGRSASPDTGNVFAKAIPKDEVSVLRFSTHAYDPDIMDPEAS